MRAFAILFLLLGPFLAAGPGLSQGQPAVDLSLTPETDGMEPKADLIVYAFVTNKSEAELSKLSLDAVSGRFEVIATTGFASSLGPLASADPQIQLRARSGEKVPFGKYQVPFILHYHWRSRPLKTVIASAAVPAKPPFARVLEGDSEQRAIMTVEVKAPYSAVASGLPGGTGPLFWLLLPVIPAFLAFQLVQGLRHKQGPQVPTFSAESVLPAFFIAIAVNSLPFWSSTLAKLDTAQLLSGSALLGALWPSCLWLRDKTRWQRWGFRDDDKPEMYFRKVLLSHWVHRPLAWVTGTVEESPTEGFLLHQPDGSVALGFDLQVTVTPAYAKTPPWLQQLFNLPSLLEQADRGGFWARRKLVFALRSGFIGVESTPTVDLQPRERLVETGQEVAGFKKKSGQRKAFLQCTI